MVAATLCVKISALLKRELQMNCDKEMFWTDSDVTLATLEMSPKNFCSQQDQTNLRIF